MLVAKATGEETEEAVGAKNISSMNMRFRPSADFKAEIENAEVKQWK